LVRGINTLAKELQWNAATHARFLRMDAVQEVTVRHVPGSEDPPIYLPAWAHSPPHDIASALVAGIEDSKVHVMGGLRSLLSSPDPHAPEPAPATTISIDAAARAVIGPARAGGAGILREKHVEPADLQKYPGVSSASSDLLMAELGRRG